MTRSSGLRLVVGVVLTVALVIGMTLLLNRRIALATSTTATISAGTYDLGSEYGGTVTELFVAEGDPVTAGEPVATLRSGALQRDLATGEVSAASLPGQVRPDGEITLIAAEDGTVDRVLTRVDSFVAAGAVVATVEVEGTQFVTATLELDPRDYARLVTGAAAEVTLPDRTRYRGTVDDVSVTSDQGTARAVVRVVSDQLASARGEALAAPGTPVTVGVTLVTSDPVSNSLTTLDQFLQRIGF